MSRNHFFPSEDSNDPQPNFSTRDRRPSRGERPKPGETRIKRIVKDNASKYRFDHRYLPDDDDF